MICRSTMRVRTPHLDQYQTVTAQSSGRRRHKLGNQREKAAVREPRRATRAAGGTEPGGSLPTPRILN
jgi:hypothetical protein